MLYPRWLVGCVLLASLMLACCSEKTGYDEQDAIICPEGLSDCTVIDTMPLPVPEDSLEVQKMEAKFNLCRDGGRCALCLVIDLELRIHPEREEDYDSGQDQDDEEAQAVQPSVSVCYKLAPTMPTCKRAEFNVIETDRTQDLAKISMVIHKPHGVTFGSHIFVYPLKSSYNLVREVIVPTRDRVSAQGTQIEDCEANKHAPVLNVSINKNANQAELWFAGGNSSFPLVCVQYERNGTCQILSRPTIPLYSVTPCTCFQIWEDEDEQRSQYCPFARAEGFQENVWRNLSVSLAEGRMNNLGTMLQWNLSAPCRLDGEVWPCRGSAGSCREMEGFRQQLGNSRWKQSRSGQWEIRGAFEDIDLQLPPCVMLKVGAEGRLLGPFCYTNTDRWRWSLLAVAGLLFLSLTVLLYFLLGNFVKKWVWSCHHSGFVKIDRKGQVVVLSPPDMDKIVSESVCALGSLLRSRGFSVSVDQWSRKEQCDLGPLAWLHSQLLELQCRGGRVVLVVNRKAEEQAEKWLRRRKENAKAKPSGRDVPQTQSPYSDVFTAALCCIQADKQMGRAGERFLLASFDPCSALPELLQGLPLFQLPSQTQTLLSELTVVGKRKGSDRRKWMRWKWAASEGWRAETEKGVQPSLQPHCKYVQV